MTAFTNSRPLNPAFAKSAARRQQSQASSISTLDSNSSVISPVEPREIKAPSSIFEDDYSPFNPKTSSADYAKKFIDFMDTSPTTYHACNFLANELEQAGFTYLSERSNWEDHIQSGTKFYTKRNGSSLVAFVIGEKWRPGLGCGIVGCHIDALAAKIKPISKKTTVEGYVQIGAAPYSGGFNPTWWDRDLGIGGRVIVRDGDAIKSKLLHIPYPVARIPSLAPHFGAPAKGPFNLETQMTPVIGLVSGNPDDDVPTEEEKKCPLIDKHHIRVLRTVAKHINVVVKDIIQWDLELFDTQPGAIGGLDKEFIFCPRIDDKVCSYTAIHGFLESVESSAKSGTINMIALFDNEEIGSQTRQGAKGGLVQHTIDRILSLHGDSTDELKRLTLANSFIVSADVIHAVNPNFSEVYLDDHKPHFNVGITISCDPNGHMTTDAVSLSLIEEIARKTDNKLQYFQIRNDSRSGGTIGPYISSDTGIRAIDLGIAQLSMHSIRATVGSKDVWLGVKFFKSFYEKWEETDVEFKLGDL
ncbi:peptidase M18, aminopeptidase I [Nadsonia fulvescens var. elongata DSM 6958]|uniref:Peptidase M18, aminopeptidase I n=1 Tax=Nadsonia fulvescens var. elongata DSM 6958 TaxID=857566 RepID=A0A1E3PKU2_9ASCO|nr:peptidase M18, aminopeptidase I [Nadsonia fulvescens var. elongata DSM 6958]